MSMKTIGKTQALGTRRKPKSMHNPAQGNPVGRVVRLEVTGTQEAAETGTSQPGHLKPSRKNGN
jgi:hypothetical protein